MQKNYIFKTKDGKDEVSYRGIAGFIKMENLKLKDPKVVVRGGGIVTTIETNFEDIETLKREVV